MFWIDAFTDRVFGGNPAAVVPLDAWPASDLLQRIANENNLSETAFFVRTGPGRAHLRWFTPLIEIDLCGHATLAAAHVLYHEFGETAPVLTFDTLSGPLHVSRRGSLIELDFPARPASPAAPSDALLRGLGTAPVAVLSTPLLWMCVYAAQRDVADLSADPAALAAAGPGRVIVTAPGDDCDFVSRFFAPDAGVPEDPVTGSSHCTLAPYWGARLGKAALHARQVSRRGGELWCALDGDRVRIAGRSVAYLRGTIGV